MPLSLTFTEGALPKGSEKEAGKRITEAFLKWHGLSGNKVMTPNGGLEGTPLSYKL